MAQRRVSRDLGNWSRRWGFRTKALPAALLVTLMCGAGAAGYALRGDGQVALVERAPGSGEEDGLGLREAGDGAQMAEEGEGSEPTTFVVHVDGAVGSPGVVHLEGADMRVFDAVEAAGGLLDDADTSSVNLAESLVDGAKIHIPHAGEQASQSEGQAITGQVSTRGATGTGETTALININLATAEELQTLSGIGEVTAQAIIEERERNGPFASCEDLMRVSGIGEKKYERVRGSICV